MNTKVAQFFFVCCMILCLESIHAQKFVTIDSKLAANSQVIKMKVGGQWVGKITKIRFGDYVVISSKNDWKTSIPSTIVANDNTKTNFSHNFSFDLADKADTVHVIATQDFASEIVTEKVRVFNEGWSNEEILVESDKLVATITSAGDSSEIWSLTVHIVKGIQEKNIDEGYLSNGDMKINIYRIISESYRHTTSRNPARGYEFVEDGLSIGAMQYYGGKSVQKDDYVWLRTDLDGKMKLILAAAMTAILQLRLDIYHRNFEF